MASISPRTFETRAPSERIRQRRQMGIAQEALADLRERAPRLRRGNGQGVGARNGGRPVGMEQDLLEQRLLAFDVEVKRSLRDTERLGDVRHLRSAIAALEKDFRRDADQGCESVGRDGSGHGGTLR
jgi:hypothetical protein